MMFFVAAAFMVVILAVIGNLLDQGFAPKECKPHSWIDNENRNRTHYLVCADCEKEPLQ